MKKAIAINLAAGVMYAVPAEYVICHWNASFVCLVWWYCCWVFFIYNLNFIFSNWKKHGGITLVLLSIYLVVISMTLPLLALSRDIFSLHTPNNQQGFLASARKKELTVVAESLLDHNLSSLDMTYGNELSVEPLAGYTSDISIPRRTKQLLSRYQFNIVHIDDRQKIVSFRYYSFQRKSLFYIYARNELKPPLLMSPAITEADIGEWNDVLRIASYAPYSFVQHDFEPAIVCPHLVKTLGTDLMETFRTREYYLLLRR